MSISTAWVMGSVRNVDLDLLVNASSQNVNGDLYLYHGTNELSLLAQVAAAMTAAGIVGATAVLTRDRRVKLSRPPVDGNFTVQWTDAALRDLLGFGGNLSGAASYTAPNISPLLFSPGKPFLSELSPRGTLGILRPLAYYTMSPSDGSAFVVSHGDRTDQRFSASHVDIERVYTAAKAGGEWVRWFDEVAAKGYRFYVYLDVLEEAGSTVTASLSNELGPYVWLPSGRAPSWDYRRAHGFDWTDFLADVSLPCRDAPEYD